jgi:hypothetical protein
MAPSTWHRHLEYLRSIGCISVNTNSKGTVITICNYDTYQLSKDNLGQQMDSRWAADGQPTLREEGEEREEVPPCGTETTGGAPPKTEGDASPNESGGAPPDQRLTTENLVFLWRSHVRVRKPEPLGVVSAGVEEMVASGIPRQAIFDEVMRGPSTTPKRDRSEWLKQMQDRLKGRLALAPERSRTEPSTGAEKFQGETDFAQFRREFATRFLGASQDSEFVAMWEPEFSKIGATIDEMRSAMQNYATDKRRLNDKKWNGVFPKEALPFLLAYIHGGRKAGPDRLVLPHGAAKFGDGRPVVDEAKRADSEEFKRLSNEVGGKRAREIIAERKDKR